MMEHHRAWLFSLPPKKLGLAWLNQADMFRYGDTDNQDLNMLDIEPIEHTDMGTWTNKSDDLSKKHANQLMENNTFVGTTRKSWFWCCAPCFGQRVEQQ